MGFELSPDLIGVWELLANACGIFPTQDAAWAIASSTAFPGEPQPVVLGDGSACEAIAPLVRRGGTLELAGARELGEPSDLLARSPIALAGLLEKIAALKLPVVLHRIPAESPTVGALTEVLGDRAWIRTSEATANPAIDLDERWEQPGGGLSSSRRSALRRSRRKAEGYGEVEVKLLEPELEIVEPLLDRALSVESRSWKGEEGTAVSQLPRMEAFFRRYARELAARGALRIDLLGIGGRDVAMQLGAEWRHRHWLFKIGYDPAYRAGSPGQLLLAESVAAAARSGLERYELLGSPDTWTGAWTKADHPCVKVVVLPRSARAAVAFGSIGWQGAERELRQRMRRAKVGLIGVASKRYVAGPELSDALVEEARYARAGYETTVGFWNGRSDPPDTVTAEARAAAEALPAGSEVSIKLAAMGGDGPALEELMALCDSRGLTLHLDALAPESAGQTRATALRLADAWPGKVGCTLPGRWARSIEDAAALGDHDVRVRVVKGEVGDLGESDPNPSVGFLEVVETLASKRCHVEVATQDAPLAEQALRCLLEARASCELQVLHAMRSAAAVRVADRLDVPVRVYVPYGTGRLLYTAGSLRQRPARALTLARDLLPLPPRRAPRFVRRPS
jgi:CelD/BcsL family acetyltransferase involved in cellulose biosynthesis